MHKLINFVSSEKGLAAMQVLAFTAALVGGILNICPTDNTTPALKVVAEVWPW
ncbi:hypothetical protein [Candidatus Chlorohelix sp.]|uniref:hypothetical protein n=1 Tax=Candidatus Chlorohelix sp. TaxID=3139201 RepID=UPI0030577015